MNCKPGQLCMVVKPLPAIGFYRWALSGLDPNWLIGSCFTVTTLASEPGEYPLWNFVEERPTLRVSSFGFPAELVQLSLPDECLMPIQPPARGSIERDRLDHPIPRLATHP